MKTITATYKIVTPMFISGADQTKAELRIPSIKGAIRFWWRALNGYQYTTTEELYAVEAKIFGGTYQDKDNKTIVTQSKIFFSFDDEEQKSSLDNYKEKYSKDDAIVYLAGQGVTNTTQYLLNSEFTLCLKSKSEIDPTVINAITIWGLFGGLGERSRKGFGSVAIQSINYDTHPESFNFSTVDEYKNKILSLLKSLDYARLTTPKYSVFSKHSKLHISIITPKKKHLAHLAHIDIAKHYKKCRKGDDKLDEKNAKIAFGQSKPRQASPLFLHIHPINGAFCNVRLYLPDDNIKDDKYIRLFLASDNTGSIINE